MSDKPTCTCRDTACPNHPTNHSEGCDRCIRKCQTQGEIPSCFFRQVHDDLTGVTDFTFEGFARFVEAHKKG